MRFFSKRTFVSSISIPLNFKNEQVLTKLIKREANRIHASLLVYEISFDLVSSKLQNMKTRLTSLLDLKNLAHFPKDVRNSLIKFESIE